MTKKLETELLSRFSSVSKLFQTEFNNLSLLRTEKITSHEEILFPPEYLIKARPKTLEAQNVFKNQYTKSDNSQENRIYWRLPE